MASGTSASASPKPRRSARTTRWPAAQSRSARRVIERNGPERGSGPLGAITIVERGCAARARATVHTISAPSAARRRRTRAASRARPGQRGRLERRLLDGHARLRQLAVERRRTSRGRCAAPSTRSPQRRAARRAGPASSPRQSAGGKRSPSSTMACPASSCATRASRSSPSPLGRAAPHALGDLAPQVLAQRGAHVEAGIDQEQRVGRGGLDGGERRHRAVAHRDQRAGAPRGTAGRARAARRGRRRRAWRARSPRTRARSRRCRAGRRAARRGRPPRAHARGGRGRAARARHRRRAARRRALRGEHRGGRRRCRRGRRWGRRRRSRGQARVTTLRRAADGWQPSRGVCSSRAARASRHRARRDLDPGRHGADRGGVRRAPRRRRAGASCRAPRVLGARLRLLRRGRGRRGLRRLVRLVGRHVPDLLPDGRRARRRASSASARPACTRGASSRCVSPAPCSPRDRRRGRRAGLGGRRRRKLARAGCRPPPNDALTGHAFLYAIALNTIGTIALLAGIVRSLRRRERPLAEPPDRRRRARRRGQRHAHAHSATPTAWCSARSSPASSIIYAGFELATQHAPLRPRRSPAESARAHGDSVQRSGVRPQCCTAPAAPYAGLGITVQRWGLTPMWRATSGVLTTDVARRRLRGSGA